MDSLCGKVHFNTRDQYTTPNVNNSCSPSEERRYIRVNYDVSLETLSEFMITSWNLGSPDIMISMISGVHQSKAWKKAEHRSALQKGIVKLANTSQTWIFTHGLNYGLAKLIGDAVREDQDRRSVRGHWDQMARSAYNQRVMQPRLIGVVPDALLNNPDQYLQGRGKVDVSLNDEFERPRPKYEMNPNHDVFVLVNNTSYTATAVFRAQLERSLQVDASARKEAVRMANLQLSRPEEEFYEPSGILDPDSQASTSAIPMVSILIQGGPAEIDQVLYYLNDNVPVIVIKGTGLMADLLAFAYEEIMERGGLDIELDHIKPEIENKMIRYFPAEFKDNEAERTVYLLKILGCIRVSHKHDRKYIMIFDLALSDSDLADLDWYILRTLFACQPQYAIHRRETIRKNLILTVMWNRPDLARSEIFQRDFSAASVQIDRDIFEQALLKRGRESFIDMFLQQGFQLNTFVTVSQLKTLFAKAEDREFFVTVVWESILEKSPATPLRDKFVDTKLNEIVEHMTGIKNFVRINDLAQGSQGRLIIDLSSSERKASNALVVWAVLMNRVDLVKVLWKFSEQPVPLALFVSSLYKNLSRFAPSSEVEKKCNENGIMFGTLAVDVLHLSYQDATNRAFEVLGEPFEDFEHMTPMELSYRVGNKHFIAHPCSQRYLNEVFNSGIRVTKGPGGFYMPDFLKIVFSAVLVFPMYFWITFPRLEATARNTKEKRKSILAGEYPLTTAPDGMECPYPALDTILSIPIAVVPVEPAADVGRKISTVTGLSQNANSTLYVAKDEPHVAIIQPAHSDAGESSLRRIRQDNDYLSPGWWSAFQSQLKLCCRSRPTKKMLADNPMTEVTTARKLICLWNAPITKFWMYQVNYWCFLLLFSTATFLPGCGNFWLDLAVWIWTWLNLLEYMCRTYFEYARRRMLSMGGRLVEMFLNMTFLLVFLFTRLLPQLEPDYFRLDLYATKILMCFATLFFYYRLVFSFFPISRKLGPMLEKIKLMTSVDFVVFLKMVTPFMIASAIAMQASLYPDYPMGWENIRMTFHRAFFSLYLTPAGDLQVESFSRCEAHRLPENGHGQSGTDVCWAGTHSRHDCPVVGVSSYSIVIQYSIILKMILVTLLSAMFYNTYSGIDREADSIWKYQRYQLVLDYSTRPALPAPLSLLAYLHRFSLKLYKAFQVVVQKATGRAKPEPVRMVPQKGEFFKYWKAMVREHCRNTDLATKNANLAKEQFKKIQEMDEELKRQRSNWYRLRERIIALEKNVKDIKMATVNGPILPADAPHSY